jgi:hypothetical protein
MYGLLFMHWQNFADVCGVTELQVQSNPSQVQEGYFKELTLRTHNSLVILRIHCTDLTEQDGRA